MDPWLEEKETSSWKLCAQHSLPLRCFCKKCNISVCGECVAVGKHAGHKPVVPIADICEALERSSRRKIEKLESVDLPRLEMCLSTVENVSVQLSSRADKCRSQICAAGKRAIATIQAIVEQKLMEVYDIETLRL